MQKDGYENDKAWLAAVQDHLHRLIISTLPAYGLAMPEDMPGLATLRVTPDGRAYWPVNGMHGGFSYWLEESEGARRLIVESWSRVVEGSGRRHAITPIGAILLDQGFV